MTSDASWEGPILFFDGVCNFCTASVRFVIERDSRKRFRFASLQSPVADKLLGSERKEDEKLASMVLVLDGRACLVVLTYLISTPTIDPFRLIYSTWLIHLILFCT